MAAIRDDEEVELLANGQRWLTTWHSPTAVPTGRPHGSAGICVSSEGGVVLISGEGRRWDFPAGRPEGAESWEETLRREMWEEACARVLEARLLGFSRGHCVEGHEEGLVLVRAFWRAEVDLAPWDPQFEVLHRRVVDAREVLGHLTVEAGYLPTFQRALEEAGLS